MKNIKTLNRSDVIISDYLGTSIRKWADAYRETKKPLPRVVMYCDTLPLRDDGGKTVICEGRWKLGIKSSDGKCETLQHFIAKMGYKLPTTGTKERCAALVDEYRAALNKTGKYAQKVENGVLNAKK